MMVRSAAFALATVVIAALLVGCGGPSSVSRADLAGKTFVSTSVSGYELVRGTEVTLHFTDQQLSASAGWTVWL